MSKVDTIMVEVTTRYPMRVEASADAFGEMFANMDCGEQVAVMAAIAKYMRAHPLQWDYIAIELELDENAQTRRDWLQAFAEDQANDR